MSDFFKLASKPVTDIKQFLKDSAGGGGIKYTPEAGTTHVLYFPAVAQKQINAETGAEEIVNTIPAISGDVHEWSDGSQFHATICLKDIIRKGPDGTLINDGRCPICDRVSDAWNIYKYRKDMEEANCKLTGVQREKHLEQVRKAIGETRKAKEPTHYIYALVAQIETNAGGPVLDEKGVPKYEMKIMKMSNKRLEKIETLLNQSGLQLAGSEISITYDNSTDRRVLVSQSTMAPRFNNKYTESYPALLNAINNDVDKFDWESIEKTFKEWEGMATDAAESLMKASFELWDNYQKELTVNKNAQYAEYISVSGGNIDGIESHDVGNGIPTMKDIMPNIPSLNNNGAVSESDVNATFSATPGVNNGQAVNGAVVAGQAVAGQAVAGPKITL